MVVALVGGRLARAPDIVMDHLGRFRSAIVLVPPTVLLVPRVAIRTALHCGAVAFLGMVTVLGLSFAFHLALLALTASVARLPAMWREGCLSFTVPPLMVALPMAMLLAMELLIREIGASSFALLVLHGRPLSAATILIVPVALRMSARFSRKIFAMVTLAVVLQAAGAWLVSVATIAVLLVVSMVVRTVLWSIASS